MSTPPVPVVGVAWYQQESYDQVLAVMADGVFFPKTHASWRQKATRMERELTRQGIRPVRVEIDPQTFRQWCVRSGATPDSAARNRFVEEALAVQPPGAA